MSDALPDPPHSGNFQRVGAISNAHVGNEFEDLVRRFFLREGLVLRLGFSVPIGVAGIKKPRKFDMGAVEPPVLVECKSHNWTIGGNIPSAKITVWNESMYYFQLGFGPINRIPKQGIF